MSYRLLPTTSVGHEQRSEKRIRSFDQKVAFPELAVNTELSQTFTGVSVTPNRNAVLVSPCLSQRNASQMPGQIFSPSGWVGGWPGLKEPNQNRALTCYCFSQKASAQTG